MRICLFGAASSLIDKIFISTVEELGKEMAKRGHTLVFGGGANGLMGAAARGIRAEGGHMIGVIPRFFGEEYVEEVCTFCDELIETDTMRERKQIMENNAEAFIVTPGGIGTFEEFFEILTLKQLCRHNKPIVLYNIDGYYDEINKTIEAATRKGFIREDCMKLFCITDKLDELFRYIEKPVIEIKTIKELKDG